MYIYELFILICSSPNDWTYVTCKAEYYICVCESSNLSAIVERGDDIVIAGQINQVRIAQLYAVSRFR